MATNKAIPLDWVKNLDNKEEFEKYLRNSTLLVKRLRQIVQDRLQVLEKDSINRKNYDSPSWAYQQADYNGEVRGLQYILQLTDFMAP